MKKLYLTVFTILVGNIYHNILPSHQQKTNIAHNFDRQYNQNYDESHRKYIEGIKTGKDFALESYKAGLEQGSHGKIEVKSFAAGVGFTATTVTAVTVVAIASSCSIS